MTSIVDDAALLGAGPAEETLTVARNVSTRYLAIATEMIVGLLVLPFNVSHLGKAAYGLWMLAASVTMYFSVLDLGYSGALVKFVAQYRARNDMRSLNEILSTTFMLFTLFGALIYLAAIVIAVFLPGIVHISPEQVAVGRIVLLVTSVNVALGTTFSVFGAVINGFQRYDINNMTGTISSVVVAAVNVGLNVLLIPPYGMEGAAIATAAAYLALFIGMVIYSQEVYYVPYQWRRIALAVGVAVGLTVLGKSLDVPLAGAVLLSAVYPLILLPLGFYLTVELRRIRGLVLSSR